MKLVKLGHRVVNLCYLILAEDGMSEPDPKTLPLGVVRITVETGRVLDFTGEDADKLRTFIEDLLSPQIVEAKVKAISAPSGRPRGPRRR